MVHEGKDRPQVTLGISDAGDERHAHLHLIAGQARRGNVLGRERIVCLLTGASIKWSAQLLSGAMGRALLEPTLAEVMGLIQQVSEKRS